MKTKATKERKLLSLAAVLLVAALLAAPTAEATRYLPEIAPKASTPVFLTPNKVDQVDAEAFWLFAETDVRLFSILALLDASEIEHITAENRIRLFEDSGAIPRPVELAAIRKLASGVLTCDVGSNIWKTGGLAEVCGSPSFQGLWTDPTTGIAYARNRWYDARNASWLSEDPKGAVDSVNLYAFVGWGPHMGRDPMGTNGVPINLFKLQHTLVDAGVDPLGDVAALGERAVGCEVAQATTITSLLSPEKELLVDTVFYAAGDVVKDVVDVLRFGQGLGKAAYGEGFSERAIGLFEDIGRGLVVTGPVLGGAGTGKLSSKSDEAVSGIKRFGKWVKGWFKKEVGEVATGRGGTGSWGPKFGIRSDPASYLTYKELKASIRKSGLSGRGKGLEAHHLLEKNFAPRFGVDPGDIISAPATPITHRNVGRAYGSGQKIDALILRELTQMGTNRSQASVAQIWKAHKTVYTRIGNPEWAEAVYRTYFQKSGVVY